MFANVGIVRIVELVQGEQWVTVTSICSLHCETGRRIHYIINTVSNSFVAYKKKEMVDEEDTKLFPSS